MAPLAFTDLTEQQVVEVLSYTAVPDPTAGPSDVLRTKAARNHLAACLGLQGHGNDQKKAIELDLYFQAFQHGAAENLTPKQISALVAMVRQTHLRAIGKRLTVERSFQGFKDLLLDHSIHRPPFSEGIFTLREAHALMAWMLTAYYRNYKLYQYALTTGRTCDVTSRTAGDGLVEYPPETPPLEDATPMEEHEAKLAEERKAKEEEETAAAEEAAKEAEERRERELKEAYDGSLPEEVRDKVAAVLEAEMTRMKTDIEGRIASETAALQERLQGLEARLSAKGK
ncbi:unnamed protein product [Pedinophyceae sp. YPF-701]|nr:unnamed protein product [Pedinophyceae sp. YPF-701]